MAPKRKIQKTMSPEELEVCQALEESISLSNVEANSQEVTERELVILKDGTPLDLTALLERAVDKAALMLQSRLSSSPSASLVGLQTQGSTPLVGLQSQGGVRQSSHVVSESEHSEHDSETESDSEELIGPDVKSETKEV